MKSRSGGAQLYRLKVTLRDTKPPVWRRFVVPSNLSLKRLHDALQAVMGWTDTHLHQFEAGGVLYGTSDPEFGAERVSERRTKLEEVLRRPKERMVYEYDFGDGWEHDVVLEALLPAEPGGAYPHVEDGRRACPPEDVGGAQGYLSFLEALADSAHPEHHEMREWVGGEFDPEAFSAQQVNAAIHGGSAPVESGARRGDDADGRRRLQLVGGSSGSAGRGRRTSPYPREGLKGARPADLAWLTGSWYADLDGDGVEEHWSPLRGNMLMAMFRWIRDGKVRFYEIEALEADGDYVYLRVRHFDPGLVGWEERTKPHEFVLVEHGEARLVFHELDKPDPRWAVYERRSPDEVLAYFTHGSEPDPDPGVFRFRRMQVPG